LRWKIVLDAANRRAGRRFIKSKTPSGEDRFATILAT
jgi:hypothetical protein